MPNLRAFQERIREQEKLRIRDIYEECEKRGCTLRCLKAFDTRVWLYPIKQAEAFLSLRSNPGTDSKWLTEHLRQYHIFLEVLVEKRPNHEKQSEWKRALQVIDDEH